MGDEPRKREAASWSAYWTGAEAASESVTGGAKGAALDKFWTAFFTERLKPGPLSMIDLACGAGPVLARAAAMAAETDCQLSIHYADYSDAAIRSVRVSSGDDDIRGFVADAATLPLSSAVYDIATSQFGLEYAGAAAFEEAARILRPGGALALVMHLKGGAIEAECAANLDIVVKAQKIELLPRAREAFEAGFAVLAGHGSRERFAEADKSLSVAVEAAKTLLAESPSVIARAFLERLYADLAHMYPRMHAYAPDDVERWMARGGFELEAYEHRMASMVAAAQSEEDLAALTGRLSSAGLVIAAPEILQMGDPLKPAAWALFAEKPI